MPCGKQRQREKNLVWFVIHNCYANMASLFGFEFMSNSCQNSARFSLTVKGTHGIIIKRSGKQAKYI